MGLCPVAGHAPVKFKKRNPKQRSLLCCKTVAHFYGEVKEKLSCFYNALKLLSWWFDSKVLRIILPELL